MSVSVVSIGNLSITRLGSTQLITSLNEDSAPAIAINASYESARDLVLKDFPWGFARKYKTLQLVGEEPNSDWLYSYRYPTDCMHIRRMVNTAGRTDPTRIPYQLSFDDQGKLILTDQEEAEIVYTAKVTNVELFSPDFISALAWRLAMDVAPFLTGGDPHKMTARATAMYSYEIERTKAASANEEEADQPLEAEFIRARE